MTRRPRWAGRRAATAALALGAGGLVLGQAGAGLAANPVANPSASLWVNPYSTTVTAASTLTGQARADALLLAQFPSADWFTKGTPAQVQAEVKKTVDAAAAVGKVPTLVVYNLPFRDCSQYSAGGAADTAAYNAWVDGVAAGIGSQKAIVILEPDGLGIIPNNTNLAGSAEWCKPTDAGANPTQRYAQLNHAVDVLKKSNTAVYLDGTHNGWLNVGDITDRLLKAGVQKADGFFLNASNYNYTEDLVQYGTWVSSCIAYVTKVVTPTKTNLDSCGNQYWSGGPANNWTGVALDPYKVWSDTATDPAANTAGINSRYAQQLGSVKPDKTFVIDTSRNGTGPWNPAGTSYSDPEAWCNPPGRGIGPRPTTQTGNPLVDAYLWIKPPGESDGQCYRGTGGPLDPERHMQDPPAGAWFPAQAAELIALGKPAVARPTCHVTYRVNGSWPGGFGVTIEITNTGATPINGWNLSWTYGAGQTLGEKWSADWSQKGAVVTAKNLSWNSVIRPGASGKLTIGYNGKTNGGANPTPQLFWLNGQACSA